MVIMATTGIPIGNVARLPSIAATYNGSWLRGKQRERHSTRFCIEDGVRCPLDPSWFRTNAERLSAALRTRHLVPRSSALGMISKGRGSAVTHDFQ